jgi:hypothetical protein
MFDVGHWLFQIAQRGSRIAVDGLVAVESYEKSGRPPEEVSLMEKASHYGADAVFFEAREGKPPIAQAFIYDLTTDWTDSDFAKLHQQLWSWGGVPLVYRFTTGSVQLFRCAHRPDFEMHGSVVLNPYRTLKLSSAITADPWWDAHRLRNGTLWDDP